MKTSNVKVGGAASRSETTSDSTSNEKILKDYSTLLLHYERTKAAMANKLSDIQATYENQIESLNDIISNKNTELTEKNALICELKGDKCSSIAYVECSLIVENNPTFDQPDTGADESGVSGAKLEAYTDFVEHYVDYRLTEIEEKTASIERLMSELPPLIVFPLIHEHEYEQQHSGTEMIINKSDIHHPSTVSDDYFEQILSAKKILNLIELGNGTPLTQQRRVHMSTKKKMYNVGTMRLSAMQ